MNDEIKINQFKKNRPMLTFKTSDPSHEPRANSIKEKPQKNTTTINKLIKNKKRKKKLDMSPSRLWNNSMLKGKIIYKKTI